MPRAEQIRDRFVDHTGEITLEVAGPDLSAHLIAGMTLDMLEAISENIKDPSIADWFLPDFTTTTDTDKVSAAAFAMGTFQEYFEYVFVIICGLPLITMKGTIDDWRQLESKVARLLDFEDTDNDFIEWVGYLSHIAENLVQSGQSGSDENLAFWDSVAKKENGDTGAISCGADPYLSGWLTAFSYFDKDGTVVARNREAFPLKQQDESPMGTTTIYNNDWPVVDIHNLQENLASVPVTIEKDWGRFNSTLFVGVMVYTLGPTDDSNTMLDEAPIEEGADLLCVKPRTDWALVAH